MDKLKAVLEQLTAGKIDVNTAAGTVEELFYKDLGHTTIDTHREERTGYPEVIFCERKTTQQIRDILTYTQGQRHNTLATRLSPEIYRELADDFPEGTYYPLPRLLTLRYTPPRRQGKGTIAVVSAGTSDSSVAEEAALTAEFYGNSVERYPDVGVAGIHRLLRRLDDLRKARVVVVVAGMEGALGSVVGGLVGAPVIAVPTSVGYGANFQGLSALLAMLNSCASGMAVVNIDNGFGAGYMASTINALP